MDLQKTSSQRSQASNQSTESSDSIRKRVSSDFEFGRQLGEGSYSTVLLAKDKLQGKNYAVKVLEKKHIVKENKVFLLGAVAFNRHGLGQVRGRRKRRFKQASCWISFTFEESTSDEPLLILP